MLSNNFNKSKIRGSVNLVLVKDSDNKSKKGQSSLMRDLMNVGEIKYQPIQAKPEVYLWIIRNCHS